MKISKISLITSLLCFIPVFFIILQVLAPYFDSAYRKEKKVAELRQKLNELSINYLIYVNDGKLDNKAFNSSLSKFDSNADFCFYYKSEISKLDTILIIGIYKEFILVLQNGEITTISEKQFSSIKKDFVLIPVPKN